MYLMVPLDVLHYLPKTLQKLLHGQLLILFCTIGWKWFLAIRRPIGSTKKDPGMPSSHATFFSFLAFYFHSFISLYILSLVVSISRVVKREHSIKDVIMGSIVGGWAGYQWNIYEVKDYEILPLWNFILFITIIIFRYLFTKSYGYKEKRIELSSRWLSTNGWSITHFLHCAIAITTADTILFYPIWVVTCNFCFDSINFYTIQNKDQNKGIWLLGSGLALFSSLLLKPGYIYLVFILVSVQYVLQRYVLNNSQLRIVVWIYQTIICLDSFINPLPIETLNEPTQLYIILLVLFRFMSGVALLKGSWERTRKSLVQSSLGIIVIIIQSLIILKYLYLSTIPILLNISSTGLLLVFYCMIKTPY